ncbi:MAG: glycosyltransferase [Deltaproteobacteria bacterium]|nr:glycosyltransferase [Deltaproteobacteria bacterium]
MGRNPLSFFGAEPSRRPPRRRYLEVKDRPRRLLAQSFSLLTVLLGAAYVYWVGRLALIQRDWQGMLFWAAEVLALLLMLLLACDTWRLRFHRPRGLKSSSPALPVDIFIPCCREPLEVVMATLRGVKAIQYPAMEVYVLDDGGSSQVAGLADSLGFHYLSRPLAGLPQDNAKSGNLNFGLDRSRGDLILVLDADQVPAPDILTRMAGFFRIPQVAYVQSKQAFFLPQGDPFYNGDKIFYEVLQVGNDQANAVISCGSGVIYRRRALEDLGGFATWNIVEDFTTSYELVSRGWKGIYFPYALSRGLAPATLAGVYRQRFQWGLDAMRLFFWDNPLWKKGLTWRRRVRFLIIMVSYLASGLVFPIFYLIPLLVYWGGGSILLGHETGYWLLRGAYLVSTVLMFRFLFYRKDALKQFKILGSLFPVYGAATLAALFYPPGRKPRYLVNNLYPFAIRERSWYLAPHLTLMGLHLTMPFLSLGLGWAMPRLVAFNSIFSALTIWILSDLVLAALSKPRWAPAMDPKVAYG